MTENKFTSNNDHTLVAVSDTDGETPVYLYADPVSHGLKIATTVNIGSVTNDGTFLSDAQLRAIPVPVSVSSIALPTGAATSAKQLPDNHNVVVTSAPTTAVTGTFFQPTQPVSGTITEANSSAIKSDLDEIALDTDNLDVALSTRTKPSDQQHAIVDSGNMTANAGTNLNTSTLALESGGNLATIAGKDFATQTTLALIKAKTDNIDVALSTRTKPADQQHVIVDSGVTTGLTDTQLRATPVPVSGTFFQGTQPVSLATNTPTLQSGSTTAVTQATASNLNATVVGTGTFPVQDFVGTVSTANSTATPLGGNGVFTGTLEDTSGYGEIRVSTFADQASATNGLSMQQSSDGTNWDITDTYTIAASTAKTFGVPRDAKFFRVVYTNGATPQGAFRLQVIYNRTATTLSSQRSSDGYTNETDLEQTWAFGSVWNGTTWDRTPGDVNGVKTKKLLGTTTTSSNVATSTTVATLVSSNTTRVKATIYNDSTAGILYIKEGAAASATSFDYALSSASSTSPGGTLIVDDYNGILTGILSTGTGNARVGETTP